MAAENVIDFNINELSLMSMDSTQNVEIDINAEEYETIGIDQTPLRKVHQTLKNLDNSYQMKCGASFIEYTNDDDQIVQQLDYFNPDSHDWYAKYYKGARGKEERKMGALSTVAKVYLDKLQMKWPNSVPNHELLVPVQVNSDMYVFGEHEYDCTARAVNEKIQWQYRAFGDIVQFFFQQERCVIGQRNCCAQIILCEHL